MRKAIAAALALLAPHFALAQSLEVGTQLQPEPPRGAILLLADDLGADLLGTCGEPGLHTPHLDRLAAAGTQFPWAFASASSCSPSRAALLTGLPSHANGQYGLAGGTNGFAQAEDVATLPLVLHRAGFFVGWIGKRHVAPESSYPHDWSWNGNGRDGAAIADAARDFFVAAADKPFLLIVGFADPHRDFGSDADIPGDRSHSYDADRVAVPRILPDRPAARDEIARYWRAISRLDHAVGALLDVLEHSGREDDTLVMFTSDNGAPFPGAKTNLYDAGIRLPFVVRNPMQIRRGVVCDAIASHTDVLPAILRWVRRPELRPKGVRDRDLLGILERDYVSEWNEAFASQSFHDVTMYYPMRTVRTRTHQLVVNLASALPFPIAEDIHRSTTWRGIVYHENPALGNRPLETYLHRPRVELYDLGADPEERKNLADDPKHADIRRGLEEKVRNWQESTEDPWLVKYSHE